MLTMTEFIGIVWNPLSFSGIYGKNACLDELRNLQEEAFVRPATLEDLVKEPLIGYNTQDEKEKKKISKKVRERVLDLLERGHAATSSPSLHTIHPYCPYRYDTEYLIEFNWDCFPLQRSQRTLIEWANYVHHHRMVNIIKEGFFLCAPAETENTWMAEKALVESAFGSYRELIALLETWKLKQIAQIETEYYSATEFLKVTF
jgi:hypothetical protein